jgi:transposase InsO family protein
MRLGWVKHYQQTGNVSLTSRRCGVSRPTLSKWLKRYQHQGIDGLLNRSRRPHRCPPNKVTAEYRRWIRQLRQRRLEPRRIQGELDRHHQVHLSTATIYQVLKQESYPLLKTNRRPRKGCKRYQKEIPGERVQMDVCKIAPQLYQFTAMLLRSGYANDDCTRLKVLRLYPNKSASSTIDFLTHVLSDLPFPIQRIQTDRGKEFMDYGVQARLMDLQIKFRPTKPRSPHLNGKVERTQRTDWEEFYSLIELQAPNLSDQLQQWQHYYNRERRHSSIGKSPWQKWQDLMALIPTQEQVSSIYQASTERIRYADYRRDIGKPRWVWSL